MTTTRSKSAHARTKKHIYRARVKSSPCRGKPSSGCVKKYGCKNTNKGRRKSYCRKRMNRSA